MPNSLLPCAAAALAMLGAVQSRAAPPASPPAAPSANTAPAAPAAKTPVATPPAVTTSAAPAAAAPKATSASSAAVFPAKIDPKYAKLSAGQGRMHTCLDQYNANKAAHANGGMTWIQKGGGYYPMCTKKLKG